METARAGRRRNDIRRRVCFRRLEILRFDLGLILEDSDVRRSGWSWGAVPFGPDREVFELPLLLAPTQGAAS
jgi:hypothetical protein